MANLIRSAKSGNNWTLNDLDSYHISLNQTDPLSFFGLQELPQPSVDSELLNTANAQAMKQAHNVELLNYLNLVMNSDSDSGETAMVDFTVVLFKIVGYFRQPRLARTRVELPLFICGESRPVTTSVCIVNRSQNRILLVVQEGRKLDEQQTNNTRAQLVVEAIGAFTENQTKRKLMGLAPMKEAVIPGLVMSGSSPTFFRIPVSESLCTHTRNGTYPPEETRVTYCYPLLPSPVPKDSEGMRPLDNRREIFRFYEAFKTIVGI